MYNWSFLLLSYPHRDQATKKLACLGSEHTTNYRISPSINEWTIKTPNPICRLFFKIDLLTDFAALCLKDFIDWRYIHSLVGIFDPACELLPPWTKELYLCTSEDDISRLVSLKFLRPCLQLLEVLFTGQRTVYTVHCSVYTTERRVCTNLVYMVLRSSGTIVFSLSMAYSSLISQHTVW